MKPGNIAGLACETTGTTLQVGMESGLDDSNSIHGPADEIDGIATELLFIYDEHVFNGSR